MILNRSLNKSLLKIGSPNRPRVENPILLLLKSELFQTQGKGCIVTGESVKLPREFKQEL